MKATFRIWRGDAQGGSFRDYATEVAEGMVVLDAVHRIQAEQANDLAVRWNCKAGKCGSCKPRPPDAPDGTWRMAQEDIERVQEFRKCIECYLCQDVCHVIREHKPAKEFIGPRFFVYAAALEMHPLDVEDRAAQLREAHGIGYCNITKCCTRVCPEDIQITDNAIIPLKERVVDQAYDPLRKLFRIFRR